MIALEIKFFGILGSDDFNRNKYDSICRQFKGNVKYDNPFLMLWCIFLTHYPLEGTLKKVFNEQDSDSGRIGVASRHLIKVAKELGDVEQHMVDAYVEAKHRYDKAKKLNKRLLGYKKERVEDNFNGKVDINDNLSDLTDLAFDEGRYKENTYVKKKILQEKTLRLLKKICILK